MKITATPHLTPINTYVYNRKKNNPPPQYERKKIRANPAIARNALYSYKFKLLRTSEID